MQRERGEGAFPLCAPSLFVCVIEHRQLGAIVKIQLLQDFVDVTLDGAGPDAEPEADVPVAQTDGDVPNDFSFTFRQ